MAYITAAMRQAILLLKKFLHRLAGPAGRRAGQDTQFLTEESFRLLTENSPDIIMRVGRDFLPVYVSPASLPVLGYAPEEMLGQPSSVFVVPEDLPEIGAAAQRALQGKNDGNTETFRMRRKDGRIIWIEGRTATIRDAATGEPGDVVAIMRDITERKQLEEQLSEQALIDSLTGLENRRAFDHAFEQEWRRTVREGTQMSLLLLDLDHFKGFNDLYGHQVGDDCLRSVAAALADALRRPGEAAARYGGEEIAVILPNTDMAGAYVVAENLRIVVEALRLPHSANPEGGGFVTVSVGAATALSRVGGTMRMPEALLAAADSALYKAKRDGRNRVATSLLLAPSETTPSSITPVAGGMG